MVLPESVQVIADVIGREKALILIGKLPRHICGIEGRKCSRIAFYIPTVKRMRLDHSLVKILGWNDALKLAKFFGGEIMQVSTCVGIYKEFIRKTIQRMRDQNLKTSTISGRLQLPEWYVRQIMKTKNPHKVVPEKAANNASLNAVR